MEPEISLLTSPDWDDYQLLDSGDGARLERFGPYSFIRPEHQAIWKRAFSEKQWDAAHAIFQPTGEESGGKWIFRKPVPQEWQMRYKGLNFWARTSSSRHLGVFPEQGNHWDWIRERIRRTDRTPNILNLFGYTGLATLAAAQAGASVTHVDASKKTVNQARENQILSKMDDRPIRWIVDDALKFVRRETRRQVTYDGLILDPPKFGRGPQGEVWEFFKMLPNLLSECRPLLSSNPLFLVITAYAIRASSLSLYYTMHELMSDHPGIITAGELVQVEQSAGRAISMAIFARWSALTEKNP